MNIVVRPQETGMPDKAIVETVIPLSKRKIVLLLLGCGAFVAGSIWIGYIADAQQRYNPLLMKGAALAGASFFGLCGIYGCIKFFDGRPGLILDAEGIVDHSSAVAAGRIPWSEITGLKVSEIAGQRFLTIKVVNVQKYVERGSILKRMLNRANTKMVGSPINISANALRMSFDELLRVLTGAYEKYRARPNQSLQ